MVPAQLSGHVAQAFDAHKGATEGIAASLPSATRCPPKRSNEGATLPAELRPQLLQHCFQHPDFSG
jgi:hypothetical protein